MKTFRKTWNNRSVQDDGCHNSKESKSFVTAFRNMLKRELKDDGIEVVRITPNHYDLSGFLVKDGKYVYVSYSIPRYGECIDFDTYDFMGHVLYRSAKNDHDYTGGRNNFSRITDLPDAIRKFYDDERNWRNAL